MPLSNSIITGHVELQCRTKHRKYSQGFHYLTVLSLSMIREVQQKHVGSKLRISYHVKYHISQKYRLYLVPYKTHIWRYN
jgi:hypothetical protein